MNLYKMIYVKGKYHPEHRLIMEQYLGRKLEEEITDLDPFKKNVYQGILLMYNDWRRGK